MLVVVVVAMVVVVVGGVSSFVITQVTSPYGSTVANASSPAIASINGGCVPMGGGPSGSPVTLQATVAV